MTPFLDGAEFQEDMTDEIVGATSCCQSLAHRAPETFTFHQSTGHFVGGKGGSAINTKAYSGNGAGYLNPAKQCAKNVGVLPANAYKLSACVNVMHGSTSRPCSFVLQPLNAAKMCGRSAFLIHGCHCGTTGDQSVPPTAGCSAGCIVMNIANRRKLRVGDTIHVVPNKGLEEGEYDMDMEEYDDLEMDDMTMMMDYNFD